MQKKLLSFKGHPSQICKALQPFVKDRKFQKEAPNAESRVQRQRRLLHMKGACRSLCSVHENLYFTKDKLQQGLLLVAKENGLEVSEEWPEQEAKKMIPSVKIVRHAISQNFAWASWILKDRPH